ncbi:MAG: C39 family peptidase [Ruminococcus sp.]|nr:C39 family peptidase [Ruminococcus sp.]
MNKRIVIITFAVMLLSIGIFLLIKRDNEEAPAIVSISITAATLPETTITTTTVTETATIPTTTTTAPETTTTEETTRTTRNIITSRTPKEYDQNSVYIDMENILQLPELPTGCEITALTTLLRFYGYDADKVTMAKDYLPVSWGNYQVIDGEIYKDSFFEYFIGDPAGSGYGCFSPAIMKAADKFLAENTPVDGKTYEAVNISGCTPDDLYDLLIEGTPVMCWATDGMIEPEYYESWFDNETGAKLDWYLNEHAFVLVGFNMDAGIITLNDPMKGIIDYNKARFELRFNQMYSQAIYIREVNSTESNDTLSS